MSSKLMVLVVTGPNCELAVGSSTTSLCFEEEVDECLRLNFSSHLALRAGLLTSPPTVLAKIAALACMLSLVSRTPFDC